MLEGSYFKGNIGNSCVSVGLAATLCIGTVLYTPGRVYGVGEGSDEPGFIAPPRERKNPPSPPRTSSSAETLLACCCCPVTPMSRTEAKKPARPPVLITKIKDERVNTSK